MSFRIVTRGASPRAWLLGACAALFVAGALSVSCWYGDKTWPITGPGVTTLTVNLAKPDPNPPQGFTRKNGDLCVRVTYMDKPNATEIKDSWGFYEGSKDENKCKAFVATEGAQLWFGKHDVRIRCCEQATSAPEACFMDAAASIATPAPLILISSLMGVVLMLALFN